MSGCQNNGRLILAWQSPFAHFARVSRGSGGLDSPLADTLDTLGFERPIRHLSAPRSCRHELHQLGVVGHGVIWTPWDSSTSSVM